jgi:uncharacterized iron-regulated membrane protein
MEGGGWLWLLIAFGMFALGIALASGIQLWRHRRRDPVTEARTEAATRRNYREGG